jgi:hypothetical protein
MVKQPQPVTDMDAYIRDVVEPSRRNTAGGDLASIGLKYLAVAEIVAANPGCAKSVPAARRPSHGDFRVGMGAVSEAIRKGLVSDEDGKLTVTEAGVQALQARRDFEQSMRPGF